MVAGVQNILAAATGTLTVLPQVSPYFEPKAVYLFGIDPAAPGTNLRFTVGAINVGGTPQMATNNQTPDGGAGGGALQEFLSDPFNRGDQPLLVGWDSFSTTGLARELTMNLFNINPAAAVRIFACVWGNAASSLNYAG
jgi:hypothetical protein